MSVEINFDWKKHLNDCCQSTEFCCVATTDDSGVWCSPVYFAWDEAFSLYFISQKSSRHMRNLEKDARVSVSIYSTAQFHSGDVAGIQLSGIAKILTEISEVNKAYSIYYSRKHPKTGRSDSGDDESTYLNESSWKFVRVIPRFIYYFDTRFFDEERQEVPTETFLTGV